MYMAIIPTLSVTVGQAVWRVSENDLETFIRILIFNGIRIFEVKPESGPVTPERRAQIQTELLASVSDGEIE